MGGSLTLSCRFKANAVLADIPQALQETFIRHLKLRTDTIANRFRPISLSLIDYLLERRPKYPKLKLEDQNFDYYLDEEDEKFPLLSLETFAGYFSSVDPEEML